MSPEQQKTQIVERLRQAAKEKGIGKVAEDTGMLRPQVYASTRKSQNPTLLTVLRIAKAVGLKISLD